MGRNLFSMDYRHPLSALQVCPELTDVKHISFVCRIRIILHGRLVPQKSCNPLECKVIAGEVPQRNELSTFAPVNETICQKSIETGNGFH